MAESKPMTAKDGKTRWLAIMRHGDYRQQANTPSAWQPWPLNDRGFEQCTVGAQALSAHLETLNLSLSNEVYCSPLLRAWQTAEQVIALLGFNVQLNTDTRLTERSVGAAANLTLDQIEEALALDPRTSAPAGGWKGDSHYKLPFPGAESLTEAGSRVANCLKDIADSNDNENALTLVVGHGASMRHAAAELGLMSLEQARAVSMHHAMPVILKCDDNGWSHIAGSWKPRQGTDKPD